METTIIELENALITGTYVNLCNQLVKDAYLENGYISVSCVPKIMDIDIFHKENVL